VLFKPGNSLSTRFILLIASIVTLSSILFALALVVIKDRLEEATFGEMVRDQLSVILDNGRDQNDIALLGDWDFYLGDDVALLPEALRSLEPGSHHSVVADGRYYQVEAARLDGQPVLLTYDISQWEEQEHTLLLWLFYGALAVLLVSLLLAWLVTRAGLQPLYALTERLACIRPDERQIQIADDFSDHEVGLLAREFDRYQHRLDQFVDREKFFSAAASHELRTPLSVIIGAVDVIEARQTDGSNDKPLQRVRRACEEMLAFIEATLFLTREDYQFTEDAGTCNVEAIVRESLAENQQQLEAQRISVNYTPATVLTVNERPSIVKMAVGNILKNAIEHTSDGRITIEQTSEALTVSDTGKGIANADLDRVFERSYTTKAGGTGLGLTLVKKICDRLGWHIVISSEEGTGTQVVIDFTGTREASEC